MSCEIPLIPSQRMVRWHLNQNDLHSVRIRDPHLHQPARLSPRLAEYPYNRPQATAYAHHASLLPNSR